MPKILAIVIELAFFVCACWMLCFLSTLLQLLQVQSTAVSLKSA